MSKKGREFDHSHYQTWVDPNELIPYPKNAKQHDKAQVKNIANSIRRFGWQQVTDGRQGGIMIDVIIKRWENLTGEKAVLING